MSYPCVFFHDLKLQEISELLDLPLSTVKTHLYNGLRKLKKSDDCPGFLRSGCFGPFAGTAWRSPQPLRRYGRQAGQIQRK
ncbi:sigma factor-like helix-turn-helix DNA-binding protein [Paenibacillus sp. DMB20]|uniref:sigma factor-like helix-turn-helix DNA-binding protein n=1 Tax=Paenibacillus sp. DMB20 TaxID=1642570 RepID=UPI001F18AC9D|nr:sigma factor-like helix-turn-helix DNA-binding protein [Paenibacillus sp. DMB20]